MLPMSDKGAGLLRRLCFFTFICLPVIDCRLMRATPRIMPQGGRTRVSQLPKEFLERGRSLLSNVKIPNMEFCSEMILRPEDQYLVLPWWYYYCQDLKDKKTKGYKGNVQFSAIHKYILDELQSYKRRLKQKTVKLSELEMELQRM